MHRNAFDIIFIAGISCSDVFLLKRDEKIYVYLAVALIYKIVNVKVSTGNPEV
jgi:hypothetical protein